MICKICNKEFKSKRAQAVHIARKHKDISSREYTIKYFYNNTIPTCKCGCAGKSTFVSFGKFREFISGHNTRLRESAYILPIESKAWWQDIYKKRYDESGKWSNPRNQGLIEKICKNCGNIFHVKVTYKSQFFCTKECYSQYKSKSISNNTKEGIAFRLGCSKGGTNSHPNWKNSNLELMFKKYLQKQKLLFKQQKQIKVNDGYISTDFFLPKYNLIIEIDGDYWHCNPKKFSANYYHSKIKLTAKEIWERDSKRNKNIKQLGYELIRIYESDLDDYISKNKLIEEEIMK